MDNLNTLDLIAAQLDGAQRAPDRFQRPHIFHAILDFCGKHESPAARMDMMFRYTQFQKCLASMTRGRPDSADFLIGAIEARPLALASAAAHAGMDALYHNVLAFKYYRMHDHARALALLERSRAHFLDLFDAGFTRAVLAMADLYLNRIRIFVASGDLTLAVAESVALISSLCDGSGTLFGRTVACDPQYSQDEQLSVAHFFVDAVVLKLLGTNDVRQISAFFDALAARADQWAPGGLRAAVLVCCGPAGAQDDDARVRALLRTAPLPTLPATLQYLIVLRQQRHPGGAGRPASTAAIARYFATFPDVQRMRASRWCSDARPTESGRDVVQLAAPLLSESGVTP